MSVAYYVTLNKSLIFFMTRMRTKIGSYFYDI